MGKVTGFIEYKRQKQPYRPIDERLLDWSQVMRTWKQDELSVQAARCMDCGIPFLPSRLPARQPDPGLERSRLPGQVAGCHRPAARNQ